MSTEYATSQSLNSNLSHLPTDENQHHLSSLFLDFVPDENSESVESLSTLLNTPTNNSLCSLLNTSSILATCSSNSPSSSSSSSPSICSSSNEPGGNNNPGPHGILVTRESFSESEFQSNLSNNNCFDNVKSLNTSNVVTLTTVLNSSTPAAGGNSVAQLLNSSSSSPSSSSIDHLTSNTPNAPVNFNSTQVNTSSDEVNNLFEQAKCFKCKLCHFICLDSDVIVDHIERMHKSNIIFICNSNNCNSNYIINSNNIFNDTTSLLSDQHRQQHNQSASNGNSIIKSCNNNNETMSNYNHYSSSNCNPPPPPQYCHHAPANDTSSPSTTSSSSSSSPTAANGNITSSVTTDPQQIYICSSCQLHLTTLEQVQRHVSSCPMSQLVLPIESQQQQQQQRQATHSLLVSTTASPMVALTTVNVPSSVPVNHSSLVTRMAPKLAPKVTKLNSTGGNCSSSILLSDATDPTNSTSTSLNLQGTNNFESINIPSINSSNNNSKSNDQVQYQVEGKLGNLNNPTNNSKGKNRKEPGPFACSRKKCTIRFTSQVNLNIHLECHMKRENSFTNDQQANYNQSNNSSGHGFKCYICSTFSSLDWASMAKHLWRCHRVDVDLYKCTQCEYRHYSLSYLENNHAKIHSSEKNYTCDMCSKKFKNSKQLLNHERRHEKKPEMSLVLKASVAEITDVNYFDKNTCRSFTCDICSRSFIDARALRVHRNVAHKITRAYTCNACGRTSASRAALKTHMRSHTGEKPFKCQECDYSTSDHNSLRRHKMRHSGERPYKCPFCTYACIQVSFYFACLYIFSLLPYNFLEKTLPDRKVSIVSIVLINDFYHFCLLFFTFSIFTLDWHTVNLAPFFLSLWWFPFLSHFAVIHLQATFEKQTSG